MLDLFQNGLHAYLKDGYTYILLCLNNVLGLLRYQRLIVIYSTLSQPSHRIYRYRTANLIMFFYCQYLLQHSRRRNVWNDLTTRSSKFYCTIVNTSYTDKVRSRAHIRGLSVTIQVSSSQNGDIIQDPTVGQLRYPMTRFCSVIFCAI